jgi:hypothetical protein
MASLWTFFHSCLYPWFPWSRYSSPLWLNTFALAASGTNLRLATNRRIHYKIIILRATRFLKSELAFRVIYGHLNFYQPLQSTLYPLLVIWQIGR